MFFYSALFVVFFILNFLQTFTALWPVILCGDRAFPVAAAHPWNSLPSHVTAAPTLSPSSVFVLNHISSHFIAPFSDSSHLYSARAVTRHFWTL